MSAQRCVLKRRIACWLCSKTDLRAHIPSKDCADNIMIEFLQHGHITALITVDVEHRADGKPVLINLGRVVLSICHKVKKSRTCRIARRVSSKTSVVGVKDFLGPWSFVF